MQFAFQVVIEKFVSIREKPMTMILISCGVSSAIMFGLFFIVPLLDREPRAQNTAAVLARSATAGKLKREEVAAR